MSPIRVKQLRPGSWYIVVRHKGKKFVRRVADNKKEADQIARDLNTELQFRGYGALMVFKPRGKYYGLSFSSYADRWIAELKKSGLKAATIASYEQNVRLHLKPYFGDLPLMDVTYGRVKDFINDKLSGLGYARSEKENAARHPYSKDAIRLMVSTLRAMMEEAVRDEILELNPVRGLGKFYSAAKKLRDAPDPFSIEDLHKVEGIAGQWLPFIMFQSRTGARVGEAAGMQWADIDLAKGEALIRRTIHLGESGDTKSPSSTRRVDLSPELVTVLEDLYRSQREYWFKEGKEVPCWVFAKHNENPPDYSVWRRAFTLMQRKAKIRERRPHDLRHTYACLNLAAGKPITYVSSQLGHKNPQITLSIYARWVPGTDPGDRAVMDKERQQERQRMVTGRNGNL